MSFTTIYFGGSVLLFLGGFTLWVLLRSSADTDECGRDEADASSSLDHHR